MPELIHDVNLDGDRTKNLVFLPAIREYPRLDNVLDDYFVTYRLALWSLYFRPHHEPISPFTRFLEDDIIVYSPSADPSCRFACRRSTLAWRACTGCDGNGRVETVESGWEKAVRFGRAEIRAAERRKGLEVGLRRLSPRRKRRRGWHSEGLDHSTSDQGHAVDHVAPSAGTWRTKWWGWR